MNFNLVNISVILLILTVEIRGGLIDGVYGRVRNTTRGLTQDVKNVWSYSKGLVVGEEQTPGEHKEEERGLIGGMIHSVHEKVHSFREHIWDVEDIPNDSGLLWNMWCRLKERLSRAKEFIFRNGDNKAIESNTPAPNEEAELIANTMNKLFFPNGTRRMDGNAFNEAVENLRKQLAEMRKPAENLTTLPNTDGVGLIDIRLAGDNIYEDPKDKDFAVGVGNDIYDKVDDGISNLKHESRKTILAVNDNTIKNVNNGMESIQSGLNVIEAKTDELKEKASDAVAREKDLLDSTYQKLNHRAKNFGVSLNQSAVDLTQVL